MKFLENSRDLREIPISTLAYIGDAVYEVYVRMYQCHVCQGKSGQLHKRSVNIVKAKAQAEAVRKLLPFFNEEELAVYRRGRNSHPAARSRHADPIEYRMATGLDIESAIWFRSISSPQVQRLAYAYVSLSSAGGIPRNLRLTPRLAASWTNGSAKKCDLSTSTTTT